MRRVRAVIVSLLLVGTAHAARSLVHRDFAVRTLPALMVAPRIGSKATAVVISAEPRPIQVRPTIDRTLQEREQLRHVARKQKGPAQLATLDQIAELSVKIATAKSGDRKERETAILDSHAVTQHGSFARYSKADRALARLAQWLAVDGRHDQAHAIYERLVARYPQSMHVAGAHLYFGERAFDRGDMTVAATHFEKVAALDSPLRPYARYKLGWVAFNAQEFPRALAHFEAVATTAIEPLRRAAASDAMRVFGYIGKPDKAFAFAEHLDKARAIELVRRLGEQYLDQGKAHDARVVYGELVKRESQKPQACLDQVSLLRATTQLGSRPDVIAAAEEAAGRVAQGGGMDCATEADALVGELAYGWHREHRNAHGDARALVRMWVVAAKLATTPERKAASARNCAIAVWQRAWQGTSANGWIEAAEVLATSKDTELASAEIDAWDNALRVARAGTPLAPDQLARVRAGLGRIGSPRAKSLLSSLDGTRTGN